MPGIRAGRSDGLIEARSMGANCLWGRPSLGKVRLDSTDEKGCYVKRAFVPPMF